MSLTPKLNNINDFRQLFKLFEHKNKLITYWVSSFDLNYFLLCGFYGNLKISTSNLALKNNMSITVSNTNQYLFIYFLKNILTNLYFNVDMGIVFKNKMLLINHFSCILTSERVTMFTSYTGNDFTKIKSISNIFKSTIWTERELQEFNFVGFEGLCDSRKLLTDYTYHKFLTPSEFKTTSYDLIYQDLYIRVLHWFFYFLFLFFLIAISFIFYNKSLLHLLILSEFIIILLICLLTTLTLYFNLYYLVGLSILLLVFGGLELSVNLLFLVIKC